VEEDDGGARERLIDVGKLACHPERSEGPWFSPSPFAPHKVNTKVPCFARNDSHCFS
jgi:hypothetical protein